jgi:hypothetical protein
MIWEGRQYGWLSLSRSRALSIYIDGEAVSIVGSLSLALALARSLSINMGKPSVWLIVSLSLSRALSLWGGRQYGWLIGGATSPDERQPAAHLSSSTELLHSTALHWFIANTIRRGVTPPSKQVALARRKAPPPKKNAAALVIVPSSVG